MKRWLVCCSMMGAGALLQLACGDEASNPPGSTNTTTGGTSVPAGATTQTTLPGQPAPTPTNTGEPSVTQPGATQPGTPNPGTTEPPPMVTQPTATSTNNPAEGGGGAMAMPTSTPTTPPNTGGVPPAGGDVLFSDDFEAGTVGQAPAGWDTFIAWVANGTNPNGTTQALVSDSDKPGSTKALHVKGGQNPAMITKPLPEGTNKLYVRAWAKMSRQLGQNPGANHETLIGIRGEPGGANNEVRFGEIKGVIGTNEVPSDNISPKQDQWGMGPVVPANQWACFEVAFLADEANHAVKAWVDGMLVHTVDSPDQWQNGALPATWMDGKFKEVILGWHSFSGADIDLWLDDVVVSTAPIGCS